MATIINKMLAIMDDIGYNTIINPVRYLHYRIVAKLNRENENRQGLRVQDLG